MEARAHAYDGGAGHTGGRRHVREGARGALRISVNEEHAPAALVEFARHREGCCRLAGAAFLAGEGEYHRGGFHGATSEEATTLGRQRQDRRR